MDTPGTRVAGQEPVTALLLGERGVAGTLDDAALRAAERLGLPYGVVTLVEGERQHVVGAAGLAPDGPVTRQSAAGWRFCVNAARRRGPFICSNTTRDPRVAADPTVRVEGVRCFVAVPLSDSGLPFLGALAVAGPDPRRVTDADVDALRALAALTVRELRRDHGVV